MNFLKNKTTLAACIGIAFITIVAIISILLGEKSVFPSSFIYWYVLIIAFLIAVIRVEQKKSQRPSDKE